MSAFCTPFRRLCCLAVLLVPGTVWANNLTISNVRLVGHDPGAGVLYAEFDVQWENSWRVSTGPANWDAVWLFAKYRTGEGIWRHVMIDAGGSVAPGAALGVAADGTGAFLYRASDGMGTASYSGVRLEWNYAAAGVAPDAEVELDVFGIEMVYVPEGAFYLGSGAVEPAAFYTYPDRTVPYRVTSEAGISVGAMAGMLYFNESEIVYHTPGIVQGSIPAAYPKGFAAFYMMKYELTQGQYVDFLNHLTYDQQAAHTVEPPSAPAGTRVLYRVTGDGSKITARNGIEIRTPGASGTPAVYGHDLTDDGLYDQAGDGQHVACNFIRLEAGLAYADWAGLRPMTELEFEKAARGTAAPVAGEYAWGNTLIAGGGSTTVTYTLSNPSHADEAVGSVQAGVGHARFINTTATAPIDQHGPLRVGIFAASFAPPSRAEAGASYYGIMELSGNLLERVVNVNFSNGRAFTGLHGNGTLTAAGLADVAAWPNIYGAGVRGGAFQHEGAIANSLGGRALDLQVSSRQLTNEYVGGSATTYPLWTGGWRGVRTAQ